MSEIWNEYKYQFYYSGTPTTTWFTGGLWSYDRLISWCNFFETCAAFKGCVGCQPRRWVMTKYFFVTQMEALEKNVTHGNSKIIVQSRKLNICLFSSKYWSAQLDSLTDATVPRARQTLGSLGRGLENGGTGEPGSQNLNLVAEFVWQ